MKSKRIASSAEEMKQKLFQTGEARASELPVDRFKAYLDYIGKTVTVPVEHIAIEDNVRKQVDQSAPKFLELVDSIRREGLLQNLVVDVRNGPNGVYLSCVSGQRRLLAAKAAGVEKAVCLLKQYGQAERVSIGLTENLVRQDLHCIDVAEGYAELRRNGWSEEEIAARFERGQRTVHRYLQIAAWPGEVKQMLRDQPEIFTTRVIFNQFVSRGFSNHAELKKAVAAKLTTVLAMPASAPKKQRQPAETQQAVKVLADKLQAEVKIKAFGDKGRLEIAYLDQPHLQRILQLLAMA